jgi:parallel beta-helix repeat protein
MRKKLTPLVMILLFFSCTKEIVTTEDQSLSNQQLKKDSKFTELNWSGFLDHFKDNVISSKGIEEEISKEYSKFSGFIAKRKQFRADQQVGLRNKPGQVAINVPGDYLTLQEAIDNAQPNGTIIINSDIVNQESNPDYGGANVVLVDVPGLKIIGENKASVSEGFIFVIAENIEISKLKLNAYLVIDGSGDGAKILDNAFTLPPNTYSFNATSILMRGPSNCLLRGNIITDVAGTLRRGIVGSDSENNSFISNTISGGVKTQGHIELYQGPGSGTRNNLIQNCILENGGSITYLGSALRILGLRSGNTIKGCTVRNVEYTGIVFDGDIFGPILGSNNTIVDCNVSDYKGFGIHMRSESLGLISGCNVSNKNADPVKTLGSEGIGLFGTDCKIVNCNSSFNNGSGIILFGHPTGNGSFNQIINCKANNNKFRGILYFAAWEQNSKADIKDCEANNNTDINNYGSILLRSTGAGSTYTIENCKINNNSGECSAGLIGFAFDYETGAKWIFKGNEVKNNLFPGIYIENSTMAEIINNKAINNTICDFDQVNSSGTVLQGNKFGSSCVDINCN